MHTYILVYPGPFFDDCFILNILVHLECAPSVCRSCAARRIRRDGGGGTFVIARQVVCRPPDGAVARENRFAGDQASSGSCFCRGADQARDHPSESDHPSEKNGLPPGCAPRRLGESMMHAKQPGRNKRTPTSRSSALGQPTARPFCWIRLGSRLSEQHVHPKKTRLSTFN